MALMRLLAGGEGVAAGDAGMGVAQAVAAGVVGEPLVAQARGDGLRLIDVPISKTRPVMQQSLLQSHKRPTALRIHHAYRTHHHDDDC